MTHAQLVQHYTAYYHHWTEVAALSKYASMNSNAASSEAKEEAERREKWATYYAGNSAALAHFHLALKNGESVSGASATRPPSPPMPPQMIDDAAAFSDGKGRGVGEKVKEVNHAAAVDAKEGCTAATTANSLTSSLTSSLDAAAAQKEQQQQQPKKKSRWAKLTTSSTVQEEDNYNKKGKSLSSIQSSISTNNDSEGLPGDGVGNSAVGGSSGEDTTYYYLDKFVQEGTSASALTTTAKRKWIDPSRTSSQSLASLHNRNDSSYYGPISSSNCTEEEEEVEEEEYVPLALDKPLGYKSTTTTTNNKSTKISPGLTKKERKKQKKILLSFSSSSLSDSPGSSSTGGVRASVGGGAPKYQLSGFNASETTLSHRAVRFQGKGGLSSAANAPTTIANVEKYMGKTTIGGGSKKVLDEADYERMTVKGTCTALEKEYLRLTSPPKSELVRPQPVLEKHLSNLKSSYYGHLNTQRKVHKGKLRDYHWFCSQFKAIRQDLTVQRIQNGFAVEVYETHAKIALEEDDINEYNQSQTQLKELYDLIDRRRRNRDREKVTQPQKTNGNVMKKKKKKTTAMIEEEEEEDIRDALKNQNEFIAYRIIYYVFLSQNKKYEGGSSDIFKVRR